MKLLLYSLNVYLIQILGRINLWLFGYTERWSRNDRLCYSEYENDEIFGRVCHISCCDCGASHYIWKANQGIYGVPFRPPNYKYAPRIPTDTVFADELAKELWDDDR